MPVDIRKPLQSALSRLKVEKQRIDQQIEAIEGALRLNGVQPGGEDRRTSRPGRKPMSAAERRAVSRRMRAYWAKRRRTPGKGRSKAA